jgi:proline dehydrogenase
VEERQQGRGQRSEQEQPMTSNMLNALLKMSLDDKRCAFRLLTYVLQKEEAEEVLETQETSQALSIVEALDNDGEKPITRSFVGRPLDPNSKASRIRSILVPFLKKNGTVSSKDVMAYLKAAIPGSNAAGIYNASGQFVKQGILVRNYGKWSLVDNTSGIQEMTG